MKRYTEKELTDLVVSKLKGVGVNDFDAKTTADHLVYADSHGILTHGTLRLKDYIDRIKEGYVNLDPKVVSKKTSNNSIYVDGDNGLGMGITYDALKDGIKLVKEGNGIVMVGVVNVNHTGTMSYYLNEIAKEGLVGMTMCIAHAQVAPFGGTKPYFGTNPFGFTAPIKDNYPFILDMATSKQAYGKVMVAKARNEQIPEGWALTKDGQPTTNPDEAVMMLPFGDAKGYGIMAMINILAGVMLNEPSGADVQTPINKDKAPQRLTQFFIIMDPKAFMDEDKFLKDMEQMKEDINSQKPAQGFDRVLIPGQRSFEYYEDTLKNGIKIEKVVDDYLNEN